MGQKPNTAPNTMATASRLIVWALLVAVVMAMVEEERMPNPFKSSKKKSKAVVPFEETSEDEVDDPIAEDVVEEKHEAPPVLKRQNAMVRDEPQPAAAPEEEQVECQLSFVKRCRPSAKCVLKGSFPRYSCVPREGAIPGSDAVAEASKLDAAAK